ncbi:MAG: DUF6065 family protein [Wenzhouxiangellaceae bacterium]
MSGQPQAVAPGTIKAYLLPGVDASVSRWLRPARPTREWMDRTPDRYAYRCIPLSAANTMGWEILNPVDCEFHWNGMTDHRQVNVWSVRPERWGPRSHFGTGVVTWELPFLFRTPPEYGLAISGPANHDKAGIQPLDGFIRTDWLPYPFTMNWRITEPGRSIRFEAGEPIARIYPYPLAILDEFQVEIHSLDEDPEFRQRFIDWAESRKAGYASRQQAEQELAQRGEMPDLDSLWSRQYAKGSGADGSREHQTVFRCKPVKPLATDDDQD